MPSSAIEIRAARDADSDALCTLIASIFAEYEGVLFILDEMPELREIATAFQKAGGQFWVAERDGEIVGCVGYSPTNGGEGIELKKLYMHGDLRRHGLGARLVERVEEAARESGAAFVDLWSDVKFETAHRFYERRGYRRDGRTRELHDESDTVEYYFRKDLAPRGTRGPQFD